MAKEISWNHLFYFYEFPACPNEKDNTFFSNMLISLPLANKVLDNGTFRLVLNLFFSSRFCRLMKYLITSMCDNACRDVAALPESLCSSASCLWWKSNNWERDIQIICTLIICLDRSSEVKKGLSHNTWASLFQILDKQMSSGSIFPAVYVAVIRLLMYILFIL